jgi:hypothetical protein
MGLELTDKKPTHLLRMRATAQMQIAVRDGPAKGAFLLVAVVRNEVTA